MLGRLLGRLKTHLGVRRRELTCASRKTHRDPNKLLGTSATLVVTSALLVVTRSY